MEKNLKPIGKLLADSWRLYKKHMNVFALIAVIPFVFGGVRMAIAPYVYNYAGAPVSLAAGSLMAVFSLLYLVFIFILPFAMTVAVHEAEHGGTPNVNAVYGRAFSSIFPYLAVLLLVVIVTLGGSILFIIPGIIASIYLSLAMYVYIFEGKSNIDALVVSAWYVRNFWWDILARKITAAILIIISMVVFVGIFAPVVFALGFGPAVFQFLFGLFAFLIIVPFSMTYMYLVYKDVKSAQHARGRTGTPEKAFLREAEMIFVILIIVAAVAAVAIFFIMSLQPQNVWTLHKSFFNPGFHRGGMMRNYQFQNRP
jgi:hypothetical protein